MSLEATYELPRQLASSFPSTYAILTEKHNDTSSTFPAMSTALSIRDQPLNSSNQTVLKLETVHQPSMTRRGNGAQYFRPTSTSPNESEEQTFVSQYDDSYAAAAKLYHRRMRGCINMRRYRKRQLDKMANLEQDIQLLRQEIDVYHMRRSNRWNTIMVGPTPWSVAAEYFRLFRCGVNPSLSTMGTTYNHSQHYLQHPIEVVHQRNFLETVIMPRALCGDQRVGVEAHLKEWETISRIFPDLDVKLTHLEEGPGGEMIVTTKAFLTFTEDTFCYAFPHLVSDYRKNIIFAKLVGRRLEIPGTGRFVWDQMMGRVTLLSFDVDFIQPISHVLGSLEYVAIMFNHALIQLDGHPVVGF